MSELTQIPFTLMNGETASLADYSGKVVLLVNVASACGLTPQYESLEALNKEYSGKGVTVLGFPANNFAGQEPGSDDEIMQFCTGTFGVSFPMAKKISVSGDDIHPLYAELLALHPAKVRNTDSKLEAILTEKNLGPAKDTDVMWNFEKFLIGKDGTVAARFAPDIAADDSRILAAIDQELAK